MNRPPPISPLFPYPTLSLSGGPRRAHAMRSAARVEALRPARAAEPPADDAHARAQRGRALFCSSSCRWMRMISSKLASRSEEHTSELQSRQYLVCRLLLEKK